MDILTAILYHDNLDLMRRDILKPPFTPAEQAVLTWFQTAVHQQEQEGKDRVRALAREAYQDGFLSGVRFGAQLMAQLTEDF